MIMFFKMPNIIYDFETLVYNYIEKTYDSIVKSYAPNYGWQ